MKINRFLSLLAVAGLLGGMPLFASAATLSTPLTVSTNFPNLGSTMTVSGNCGTGGANSTTSFLIVQNGTSTSIPASSANLNTDATGAFSGTITFPSASTAGPAMLQARCNASGDLINSAGITIPATSSTTFNLGAVPPSQGGTFNLVGSCGGSNGTGTAQLNLVSNGTTTSLGTVNLTSTGTFAGLVMVPSTISGGSSTFNAVCSNGLAITSPVNIGAPSVTSFSTNTNPTLGTSAAVTGSCGATGGNANGQASFALFTNGTLTPLAASGTATGSNGAFTSTITYPTNFASGPSTLVVTCPTGSTFTSPVVLISGTPTGLAIPPVTDPGITAPAVDTGATPVGGVNAGTPVSHQTTGSLVALALVLLGAAGYYIAKRRTHGESA